jgi:hypothetical protein
MIYRFKAFNHIDANIDKLLYRPNLALRFIDKTVFLNPQKIDKSINRYEQYLFIRLSLEG